MTKEYNSSQVFSSLCCLLTSVHCEKGCQEHMFSLKHVQTSKNMATPVEISLCPFLDKSKSIIENVWPVINFDGKPHLPAFMLEIDKSPIRLSEDQYLESFEKRVTESLNPKTFTIQPYPGFEKKTCHVCKCSFKNYNTHIRSRSHRQNIRKNSFETDIKQLEMYYLQSCQTLQNWNNQFHTKRLRGLKRFLKTSSSKPSSNIQKPKQLIEKRENAKHEEIEIEEERQQKIDHRQETLTTKKSQEKTGLNPNSIC